MRGWRDILLRVKNQLAEDNASLIAAGLAMYALLAAFPALAAIVSLYGLVVSPSQLSQQFDVLVQILPTDAARILQDAMENISSSQDGTLGIGALVAFLIALWSARKGMVALMAATNVAYDEREDRGFFKKILLSLAFTLGAVLGFVFVLVLAVGAPTALAAVDLPPPLEAVLSVVRWVVLWFFVVLALGLVYRLAPSRSRPKWRWVTWGSAIAATLWLVGSLLFALYVNNFGNYGEMYGAIGGVIILLLWFFLSGFIVVLGAEINAEMEHQTARDTTTGERKPMGERGAYVADHLGQ